MTQLDKSKHTFAICAYKESRYLEECITSLKKQSMKSKIILITSTPNRLIDEVAKSISYMYMSIKMEELYKTGIMHMKWQIQTMLRLRIRMMYIIQNIQSK